MTEEQIRLVLSIQGAGNLQEAKAAADKLKDSLEGASRGSANMGRSLLESGRIVQDFAQGGIGGILNNIEGFTRAIGLGAGAAGALTILGVGFAMLTPKIKSFIDGIKDGQNEIPKATDRLRAMDDELKAATKQLDEYREKKILTNKELAHFNELTGTAARLQKELTEAKKRDAEFEKLRHQQTEGEQEDAGALQAFIGPNIDDLRRDVRGEVTARGAKTMQRGALGQLNERLSMVVRGAQMGMPDSGPEVVERARRAVEAERQRLSAEADKVVQRMIEGRRGGVERTLEFLPPGSRFRRPLEQFTGEARRRQDKEAEEAEEAAQGVIDRRRRMREERNDKLKAGRENAALIRQRQDKELQDQDRAEQQMHHNIREAHAIDEKFQNMKPARTERIPLIPENGTPMEKQTAMMQGKLLLNQQAITESLERIQLANEIRDRNRRLVRVIGRGVEQGPQAGGNGR